jgi:hypothetical protein
MMQDGDAWLGTWLAAAIATAQVRGVHLVELTDDKGVLLVAASRHPFTSLC